MSSAQLRVILADDEPLALQLLQALVSRQPSVEVVAACKNGRDVLKAVRNHSVDVLILDIEMPGMTGFDVVYALQGDVLPMVIFVTAYSDYAVQAFDVHAVDYLLKPIDAERMDLALDRALARRRQLESPLSDKGSVVEAAARINTEQRLVSPSEAVFSQQPRKIALRDHGEVKLIDFSDVMWIDAAGDYMCIHVKDDQTYVIRITMNELIGRLSDENFVRIHRSTAVNLTYIQSAASLPKGEFMLTLRGGAQLKVSRNFRETIKDFLDQHA